MVNRKDHYSTLAELFRYPGENFIGKLNNCMKLLEDHYPEAAVELNVFRSYMVDCTADRREELFTKTFDVQPVCYLDLGYVMFGEDYKRGVFLLNMQQEQRKIGNDCGTDLPDNICNVLNLMTISDDRAFVEDLVWSIFIPCLKKMIAEFEIARVDLKIKVLRKLHSAIIQEELNKGNVYRNCFTALAVVLKADFGEKEIVSDETAVLHSVHHQSFFNKQQILINNFKIE
jgi:nitrate reductase assembly molybdenum cofactor insertion protein NarJ